ncbi:sortase [Patescibacteria group bacterium]|nr:sortase [Patescibacteria group bacterium]
MKNFTKVIDDIMANKFHFLAAFFCIFTLSYGILYALDFYPEPITADAVSEEATTTAEVVENTEEATPVAPAVTIDEADTLPLSITIPALDRTVKVLNPASNSVEALDTALLDGVIRHPDSATFAEEGNMFIMGHSSYLPTVHNRNFQAFNGVQNLKFGDTITLESKNLEYTYRVEKTYKVKASGYTVPIAGKGKTLTLVTCNSFGSTEDRYVVEATLISTKALN